MKRLRLAVVGFGRVGQACAAIIHDSRDLALAGLVRRPEHTGHLLPERFRHIPVASQIGQLLDLQGALICVPTTAAEEVGLACLHHRVPVVDCATLHGDPMQAHQAALHRVAIHRGVPAVVGAGWDPGALSLFRSLFALLAPGGSTDITRHMGVHLHRAALAQGIPGVKDALCTELRRADGPMQRYVYVEVEKDADADRVAQAVRADPLFLNEETFVFPVESVAALEREGRGVALERRGAPGPLGHQQFLLEARFDESIVTAHMMLSAARALPVLKPGAHALLDVPLTALWGTQQEKAAHEWV